MAHWVFASHKMYVQIQIKKKNKNKSEKSGQTRTAKPFNLLLFQPSEAKSIEAKVFHIKLIFVVYQFWFDFISFGPIVCFFHRNCVFCYICIFIRIVCALRRSKQAIILREFMVQQMLRNEYENFLSGGKHPATKCTHTKRNQFSFLSDLHLNEKDQKSCNLQYISFLCLREVIGDLVWLLITLSFLPCFAPRAVLCAHRW